MWKRFLAENSGNNNHIRKYGLKFNDNVEEFGRFSKKIHNIMQSDTVNGRVHTRKYPQRYINKNKKWQSINTILQL